MNLFFVKIVMERTSEPGSSKLIERINRVSLTARDGRYQKLKMSELREIFIYGKSILLFAFQSNSMTVKRLNSI